MVADDHHAFMAKAYEKIWIYSTALFLSPRSAAGFRPCGAATLVRVGHRRCLLTAAHVWQLFQQGDPPDSQEQIAVMIDERRGAVTMRSMVLNCLHTSKPPWGEWGPDLALLELSPVDAGRIESVGKAFYDLTRRRGEALAADVRPQSGIWFIVAAPGEWVEDKGRQPDGATRMRVDLGVLATTIRAAHDRNGFDYLDLSLYDKRDPGFPHSYGGLSGAGVWRVGESEGDRIRWDGDAVSLEGVVFLHRAGPTPADEAIRAHGRRSIYAKLLARFGA